MINEKKGVLIRWIGGGEGRHWSLSIVVASHSAYHKVD